MEKIEAIEEFEGRKREDNSWGRESGFLIRTTEQEIILAIDDDQQCCEGWGYFLTEDDTSKFIGAELQGVNLTDTNLSTIEFKGDWNYDEPKDGQEVEYLGAGGVMFVNIVTSRGTLQFVAYNSHNGYYGHEARVSSKQLTHSDTV